MQWEPFAAVKRKPDLTAQIALLEAAVEQEPQRSRLRCSLGAALADARRPFDALEQFRAAVRISPQDRALRHRLAEALLNCELTSEAAPVLQALWEENPDTEDGVDLSYARALVRTGRSADALALYRMRLEAEPTHDEAICGATWLLLREGKPLAALELIESIRRRGMPTTRMLVQLVTILRVLQRHDEALRIEGIEPFLHVGDLPVPQGWSSLDAFNAALVQELNLHPGRRFENPRRRTRGGWRINALQVPAWQSLQALFDSIRSVIDQYVERIRLLGSHPFLDCMPARVHFKPWAIWMAMDAYQEWHIHPEGWLSGVYYVAVPEGLHGTQGALALGTPELAELRIPVSGYCTWHRPRSGELVLFPAHCYHRTLPTRTAAERICIAFDVAAADARSQ